MANQLATEKALSLAQKVSLEQPKATSQLVWLPWQDQIYKTLWSAGFTGLPNSRNAESPQCQSRSCPFANFLGSFLVPTPQLGGVLWLHTESLAGWVCVGIWVRKWGGRLAVDGEVEAQCGLDEPLSGPTGSWRALSVSGSVSVSLDCVSLCKWAIPGWISLRAAEMEPELLFNWTRPMGAVSSCLQGFGPCFSMPATEGFLCDGWGDMNQIPALSRGQLFNVECSAWVRLNA